jgi:drug/metabolite transporter (DMT)-like permease
MNEGPGERAERIRSRHLSGVFAALMLLGGVIGAALYYLQHGETGALPAAVAIALTLLYVVGTSLGSWYFFRRTDEVELRDNLLAGTWALYFYSLLYPAWFFLWKGRLVSEPDHEILFIGTMIVLSAAYFWKKIRP